MRLTIPELAKLCHTSRGTVDRALNGRPGISDKTRAHILEVAQQHGYTPNVLARYLATGKTNTIGIVVFDLRNRHFAQLISSIYEKATNAGYFCYICITEKDKERELTILRDLVSRKVEGVILMPVNNSPAFEEELSALHVPVVTVSNSLSEQFPFVGGNFLEAAYHGMEEFYCRGYRNVSFICPSVVNQNNENAYAQVERAKGYDRFMNDHPEMRGDLITTYDYLEVILQKVQAKEEKIGFFCSSDYYACNILKVAKTHGLGIPEDFGLMGFDRIDTLDLMDKQLTTMEYPINQVGSYAADLLIHIIQGENSYPTGKVFSCDLCTGQTL